MKSFIKLLSLFIVFSFVACDVNFDEEYRAYIDNIAERNPLNFTINGETLIDSERALNMGYLISNKTSTYTVTNNEKVDIHLAEFTGVDGDFTISPFTAFTLESGKSFSFEVTFNATADNWEKTVSKDVAFYDSDNRPFRFNLWATSDKQPLQFYNSEGNLLTELDIQAWDDNRSFEVTIVNEGLSNVNINSTNIPSGIMYNSDFVYSLDIHESKILNLSYDFYTYIIVNGDFMYVNTDFPYDNTLELKLFAGGGLPATFKDSGNIDIGNNYNFTTPIATPVSETFSITNNGDKSFNVELRLNNVANADLYNFTPATMVVDSLSSGNFTVSFRPESTGTFSVDLILRDTFTNRYQTVTFNGTGT